MSRWSGICSLQEPTLPQEYLNENLKRALRLRSDVLICYAFGASLPQEELDENLGRAPSRNIEHIFELLLNAVFSLPPEKRSENLDECQRNAFAQNNQTMANMLLDAIESLTQ